MRKTSLGVLLACVAATLITVLLPAAVTLAQDAAALEEGRKLSFDRKKGNCLACHMIDDGSLPGNQGPPLVAMQARFPDREALKAQIYNPLDKNPNSVMPPFGLHNILSESEIDAIVDYLLTL